MKKTSVALVAASALLTSAAATAQEWYIAPAIGFVAADKDDFDTGLAIAGNAGMQIAEKWNIEIGAAFSDLEVTNTGDYERTAATVSGLFFPFDRGQEWSPFAIASVGLASVDFAGASNTAPTIEVGAGVLKTLADHDFTLRGELRYQLDIHDGEAAFNDDTFYGWAALVGAQFAFGGEGSEEMPATASDAPMVLPAVTFPLDSAQLTRDARATLDEVVAVMEAHPDLTVTVLGHADDTGPSDYNFTLSVQRAAAVMDYLRDAGVADDRLNTRGAGEGRPVASNSTDDGRQRNRRVEFEVN